MSEFAIVVPAIGEQDLIDETLVSVLESRSPGTRIVVPCDANYEDPYDLGDEVDFLPFDIRGEIRKAPSQQPFAAWTVFANEALYAMRQSFFGLVLPGIRIPDDGSATAACHALKAHREVACVSPSIVSDSGTNRATSGVTLRKGQRVELTPSRLNRFADRVIAPTMMAGFYRTAALLDVGGWNVTVHPKVADVELATRLFRAGYEFEMIDAPLRLASNPDLGRENFRLARDLQQMQRGYVETDRGLGSLQPFGLITEFLSNVGSGAISTLAGRNCRRLWKASATAS